MEKPCSCRDDRMDKTCGPHVREFEQVWRGERFKAYDWVCRSCGKTKEGWVENHLYINLE
jgi:hypothetical protein